MEVATTPKRMCPYSTTLTSLMTSTTRKVLPLAAALQGAGLMSKTCSGANVGGGHLKSCNGLRVSNVEAKKRNQMNVVTPNEIPNVK